MKIQLIDDVGNFWKFWSVRLSVPAIACGAGLTAYAAAKALAPESVAHFPMWALNAMAIGSVFFSIAAALARGVKQQKLMEDEPKC